MVKLGYGISSEEHAPLDIVGHAKRAEEVGFGYSLISDHFHPWVPAQGHSPFVWSVIGGIGAATKKLRLGTGVTCPIIRIHPAIMAQAAATSACMLPDRFFFGIGTGERLNEHVLGDQWPPFAIRLEMLEEAVELMRYLWQGGTKSFRGEYYEVENARIYDLPVTPPPIMIAAEGKEGAEVAGRIGDGLVNHTPEPEPVKAFEKAGGKGKPKYGQMKVCWAKDEAAARKTALEMWPTSSLKPPLNVEISLPEHYESAAQGATEEEIARKIVCGPDPAKHLEMVQKYADAGYDHVYVTQVGPDQEGFFRFYQREILPKFAA